MRKKLIAGNWKMNLDFKNAMDLVKDLKAKDINFDKTDVLVFPPYVYLTEIIKILGDSEIEAGSQNLYCEEKGAFTGEVSPMMLKSIGCLYTIIGHSERRHIFNEDNELINKKVKKAFEFGLKPVLCVGETLQQRKNKELFDVVKNQTEEGLKSIKIESGDELIMAYEPVWAIGTGENATPEQAEEMHEFIRNEVLKNIYGEEISNKLRILYGGSVKPENSKGLLEKPDIDGALVGGASLKADSYYGIIKTVV